MSMMTVSANWNAKRKKRVNFVEASWGSLSVPEAPMYLGFAGEAYDNQGGISELVAHGPDVEAVRRAVDEAYDNPEEYMHWAYIVAVKDHVTIIARRDGWDIDEETRGFGWLPGGYDE